MLFQRSPKKQETYIVHGGENKCDMEHNKMTKYEAAQHRHWPGIGPQQRAYTTNEIYAEDDGGRQIRSVDGKREIALQRALTGTLSGYFLRIFWPSVFLFSNTLSSLYWNFILHHRACTSKEAKPNVKKRNGKHSNKN